LLCAAVTDWLTAIGTVGSVIVALFLALYGDWLRQLNFRPELHLTARVAPPDSERTKWTLPQRDGSILSGDVYYFRLRITNSGNVAAKDVQLFLAGVERVNGDREEPAPRFSPMSLKWSYTDKPIAPAVWAGEIPRFCDFGHITHPTLRRSLREDLPNVPSMDAVLALDLEVKANTGGHLLEAGTYHINLILVAENYSPHHESLEIVFPGKWFDDSETMFKAGFKMRKL
jgi:hypothetical protein